MWYNTGDMEKIGLLATLACAALCGCRLLETGYGDDVAAVRASADAVSAATGAARSAVAWTGAKILSFADDLEPRERVRLIALGEHAAAAYRNRPDLPQGFRPLNAEEYARLGLPEGRYRYEPATGYVEDAGGAGFGARLSRNAAAGDFVVAFRGSNAPGEDEHWMQDWVVDAHQGGGGVPLQYEYGAEVAAAVRKTFPDAPLVVAGHSLGGGIAAYSMFKLTDGSRVSCATYNAAGISSATLFGLPKNVVEAVSGAIVNVRSKGDPVSAIPGTQLVGAIYEVDNLRFANHSIDGLLVDMRRRAEGRRAGWLRDFFDD